MISIELNGIIYILIHQWIKSLVFLINAWNQFFGIFWGSFFFCPAEGHHQKSSHFWRDTSWSLRWINWSLIQIKVWNLEWMDRQMHGYMEGWRDRYTITIPMSPGNVPSGHSNYWMKSNCNLQDLSFHDSPQILTEYYQLKYANHHSLCTGSPLFLNSADLSVKFWFEVQVSVSEALDLMIYADSKLAKSWINSLRLSDAYACQ